MRIKLDKNLDVGSQAMFAAGGHDALTVYDQAAQGLADGQLWLRCCEEERTLVTQDLDLANALAYRVSGTPGIIVLRGPNTRFAIQRLLIAQVVHELARSSPAGKLWIVEPGRIRIRDSLD